MELLLIMLAMVQAIGTQAATAHPQDTSESTLSMAANAANDVGDSSTPLLQVQKAQTTVIKTVIELKTITTTLLYPSSGPQAPTTDEATHQQGNGSDASSSGWWDSVTNLASSAMVSMTAPKASITAPAAQTKSANSANWWHSTTNIASAAMVSMTAPKAPNIPTVVVTTTVDAVKTVFDDVTVTVTAETTTHAQLQHRAFVNAPGEDKNIQPIGTVIWDYYAPAASITAKPMIAPPPLALRKRQSSDLTNICTDFQNGLPMSCATFIPPATELPAIQFPYCWCITKPWVDGHFCGPFFVIQKAGAVSMTFNSDGEPFVVRAASTAAVPAGQAPATQTAAQPTTQPAPPPPTTQPVVQPPTQQVPPPPAVQTTTVMQPAAPPAPAQTTTVVSQAPAPAPVTTTVVNQAPAPAPVTITVVNNAPAPEPVTMTVVANASAPEPVTQTVVHEAATPEPVTMTITTQDSVSTPQPITRTITEILKPLRPESKSGSAISSPSSFISKSKAVSISTSPAIAASLAQSSSSAKPALASQIPSSSSASGSSVRVVSSLGFITSVSRTSPTTTRLCENSSTWEWWKDTQLYTGSGECEVRESSAAEVKRGRFGSIEDYEKWKVAVGTILVGCFALWMLA